jgi:hypothetical protein
MRQSEDQQSGGSIMTDDEVERIAKLLYDCVTHQWKARTGDDYPTWDMASPWDRMFFRELAKDAVTYLCPSPVVVEGSK